MLASAKELFAVSCVTAVFVLACLLAFLMFLVAPFLACLLFDVQDIFQACRGWTIAVFQHVTQNDFLIRLLG